MMRLQGGRVTNDDAALVERARAGDGQAFAELFDRFVDEVYDFAWRVLRQGTAAADVTRDTFVRGARSLSGIPDPAAFPTWLMAIAYHRAMERLEQGAVKPAPPPEGDPTRTEDQGILAAGADLPALVWDAAAGLDRRHYALLDLTTRHAFLPGDVASVLGVPPARGAELVKRVHGAVDEALTAYIAARRERDNCPGLAAIVPRGPIRVFPPDMRRQVTEHIRRDPRCQAAVAALPSPRQVLAALEPLPVPADLRESLGAHLPGLFAAGAAAGMAGAFAAGAAVETVPAAAAEPPTAGREPEEIGEPPPPVGAGDEQTAEENPPEEEASVPDEAGAAAAAAGAAAATAGAAAGEDASGALLQPESVQAGMSPSGPAPLEPPQATPHRPFPRGDSGVPPRGPAAPPAAGGSFWEYVQQHWTVLGAGAIFGIGLVVMGVALLMTAFGSGGGGGGAAKGTPTATASITATARPTQSATPTVPATDTPPPATATDTPAPATETPPPPTSTSVITPTVRALTATPTTIAPAASATAGPPVTTVVVPPTAAP